MSLSTASATVRAEIAGALTDVEGIYPTGDTPGDMGTGSCWPMLAGLEATGAPGVFTATWILRVVTGGEQQDGTAFMDAHLADIIDALKPVAYVQSVAPVILASAGGAGDLYGIDIRIVRE